MVPGVACPMPPLATPSQPLAQPDNHFLAALEPHEAAEVRSLLRRVVIKIGTIIVNQGAPVSHVYLPIDAQFANLIRFSDGTTVETTVVGHEGLTGLAPFLADRPSAWEIVCRASGEAWVARAMALRTLAVSRPALMTRLLALTDLYQAQAAQTAACNALHPIQDRVARWILTARDLSPNESLVFRQDEVARLIGARRSTVSEAASELKRRRLITYGRGVIRIIDRNGLQAMACDCYLMIRPRMEQHNRSPDPGSLQPKVGLAT